MGARRSVAERIFSRLAVGDCWVWTGCRNDRGYGQAAVGNGKRAYVHRWVWEYLVGPVPDGLVLDHLCRNPPCANPDHLQPVSGKTNTLRGVGFGARNARKTHCPEGHLYDEASTRITRRGWRICRTCHAASQRQLRARQRREVAA